MYMAFGVKAGKVSLGGKRVLADSLKLEEEAGGPLTYMLYRLCFNKDKNKNKVSNSRRRQGVL